jgi:hypothetical protein
MVLSSSRGVCVFCNVEYMFMIFVIVKFCNFEFWYSINITYLLLCLAVWILVWWCYHCYFYLQYAKVYYQYMYLLCLCICNFLFILMRPVSVYIHTVAPAECMSVYCFGRSVWLLPLIYLSWGCVLLCRNVRVMSEIWDCMCLMYISFICKLSLLIL